MSRYKIKRHEKGYVLALGEYVLSINTEPMDEEHYSYPNSEEYRYRHFKDCYGEMRYYIYPTVEEARRTRDELEKKYLTEHPSVENKVMVLLGCLIVSISFNILLLLTWLGVLHSD